MTTQTLTRTHSGHRNASVIGRVLNALAVWRQRRHLADLDSHILRDIGLTREAADREAARPLWDAPEHWLR